MAIRDSGYIDGMKEGEKKGKIEGKNEGIAEEKLQIAKIMLKKKMLLEDIIEITRLSKSEIESLI